MNGVGVCAYEEERRQKVQDNRRVLQSLGLPGISARPPVQPAQKRRHILSGQPDGPHSLAPTAHTYSTRFHGAVTVSYQELDDEPGECQRRRSPKSRHWHGSLNPHDPGIRTPESYTQKQLVCYIHFTHSLPFQHDIFHAFVFYTMVDRNHLEHANNLMIGSQHFQRFMMPMEQHVINADRKLKTGKQSVPIVIQFVVNSVGCVFSFVMERIWMKSCNFWRVVVNGYVLCAVTFVTVAFVAPENTGHQQESWLHTSKIILLWHIILSTNIWMQTQKKKIHLTLKQ